MFELALIQKFFVVSIVIIGFFVAFWVYFSNRKSITNQLFLLMTINLLSWIIFSYLSDLSLNDSVHNSIFYRKLVFSSTSFFVISSYFFTVNFPKKNGKNSLLDKIILVFGTVFFFVSVLTDLIVKNVKTENIESNFIKGSLADIFYILLILFIFLIIALLFKKYFSLSYTEKLKVQYFLIGAFIFAFTNLIFSIFPLVFFNTYKYHWVGDYSTMIFIAFTAYAIVKHELMGIKTLLTQVLIVVISVILFIDVLFLSDDLTMQLLKIGILLAFLYFSREMVKSVRKEKEAREELERINIYLEEKTQDLVSLLSLNEMVSSTEEIENSVQNIMDAVPEKLGHLGIIGTLLIRYNEKTKKVCAYITTESDKIGQAKKLLSKPKLNDYCFTVNTKNSKNHSLIVKSILNNKIETGSNFADFVSSAILTQSTAAQIQKSLDAKAFVSVPMTIRGKKKGALVFVFIKAMAEISQRDFGLITAFTQHVSVVLDNLHFYHHLNKSIEELTHTKDKLKEMLSMKNDFMHIVSHQLRTPLTAMRGFISMWSEGDFDSLPKDKMGEIKSRIVNNSERLNNIVNDMVMAMESEGELKVEFKPVDLRKLLAGNIEMLKPSYEKKELYLKYKETTKNIPEIEADEKLMLNVFMNLIDNAEKYTNKGGLTIAVGQVGDNVKIQFTDTGIGLSKEDKKILFKKFSRGAKSNYINPNGSGLGLFIIKQIIRKHHGIIKATSKGSGKGSTFTITLPVRQGR